MRRVLAPSLSAPQAIRFAFARVLMLVTLVAFSTQTYLTQTHIHLQSESRASISASQPVGGFGKFAARLLAAPKEKKPVGDDPANCPICQELMHAGHFVMRAASALTLPSYSVFTAEVVSPAPWFVAAITHGWHGRAPPSR